jgi:hypothetical protein
MNASTIVSNREVGLRTAESRDAPYRSHEESSAATFDGVHWLSQAQTFKTCSRQKCPQLSDCGHFCLCSVVQFCKAVPSGQGAFDNERCAVLDSRILSSSISAERGSARRGQPRQGTWIKSNV